MHKHQLKLTEKFLHPRLLQLKCGCGVTVVTSNSNITGPLTNPILARKYWEFGWAIQIPNYELMFVSDGARLL